MREPFASTQTHSTIGVMSLQAGSPIGVHVDNVRRGGAGQAETGQAGEHDDHRQHRAAQHGTGRGTWRSTSVLLHGKPF